MSATFLILPKNIRTEVTSLLPRNQTPLFLQVTQLIIREFSIHGVLQEGKPRDNMGRG